MRDRRLLVADAGGLLVLALVFGLLLGALAGLPSYLIGPRPAPPAGQCGAERAP